MLLRMVSKYKLADEIYNYSSRLPEEMEELFIGHKTFVVWSGCPVTVPIRTSMKTVHMAAVLFALEKT